MRNLLQKNNERLGIIANITHYKGGTMNDKKNILILGAGLMQRPAIEAAKKIGARAVVIDGNPNAVCVPLADEFFHIDLKDRDAILELAKKLDAEGGLRAIFTAGTDFSASVSYVAEKLNLNAHSFEATLNASIKTRMRECFDKNHIPSPKFFCVEKSDSDEKILEMVNSLGFPCVIKPVDNMGARGCRMIRNKNEVSSAIKDARDNSRSGSAILEEYMAGPEFSIDALVHDGTFTITGFAIRHIFFEPYFIEMGHTMPAVIDSVERNELIATFALAAKSLGLTEGAAKADIKYTAKGPMIGEIAARLSGGYMSGWTYPYASDFDLTESALDIASGKNPEKLIAKRIPVEYTPPKSCEKLEKPYEIFEVPCVRTCAERAYISIPGIIAEITGEDKAKISENVKELFPRGFKAGDKVDFPRNNVQKCGNVIAIADTFEKAAEAAENACSKILIRLEPNNNRTDSFLRGECSEDEIGFPPSAFADVSASANESVLADARDWNHISYEKSVELLKEFYPDIDVADKKNRNALLRGGLQAALYVAENEVQ